MSEFDEFFAEMKEWFDEVDKTVPGVADAVWGLVVGHIPKQDEQKIYQLSEQYGLGAQKVLQAASDARDYGDPIVSGRSGASAARWNQEWFKYLGDMNNVGNGYSSMQSATYQFGMHVEQMKFVVIVNMVILAIMIFFAILSSLLSAGITLATIGGAILAFGRAILAAAANTLARILAIRSISLIAIRAAAIEAFKVAAPALGRALLNALASILRAPGIVLSTVGRMPSMVLSSVERLPAALGASLSRTPAVFTNYVLRGLGTRMAIGAGIMGGVDLAGQLWMLRRGRPLNLLEVATAAGAGSIFGIMAGPLPMQVALGATAGGLAALFQDGVNYIAAGGRDPEGNPLEVHLLRDALHGVAQGAVLGFAFGAISAHHTQTVTLDHPVDLATFVERYVDPDALVALRIPGAKDLAILTGSQLADVLAHPNQHPPQLVEVAQRTYMLQGDQVYGRPPPTGGAANSQVVVRSVHQYRAPTLAEPTLVEGPEVLSARLVEGHPIELRFTELPVGDLPVVEIRPTAEGGSGVQSMRDAILNLAPEKRTDVRQLFLDEAEASRLQIQELGPQAKLEAQLESLRQDYLKKDDALDAYRQERDARIEAQLKQEHAEHEAFQQQLRDNQLSRDPKLEAYRQERDARIEAQLKQEHAEHEAFQQQLRDNQLSRDPKLEAYRQERDARIEAQLKQEHAEHEAFQQQLRDNQLSRDPKLEAYRQERDARIEAQLKQEHAEHEAFQQQLRDNQLSRDPKLEAYRQERDARIEAQLKQEHAEHEAFQQQLRDNQLSRDPKLEAYRQERDARILASIETREPSASARLEAAERRLQWAEDGLSLLDQALSESGRIEGSDQSVLRGLESPVQTEPLGSQRLEPQRQAQWEAEQQAREQLRHMPAEPKPPKVRVSEVEIDSWLDRELRRIEDDKLAALLADDAGVTSPEGKGSESTEPRWTLELADLDVRSTDAISEVGSDALATPPHLFTDPHAFVPPNEGTSRATASTERPPTGPPSERPLSPSNEPGSATVRSPQPVTEPPDVDPAQPRPEEENRAVPIGSVPSPSGDVSPGAGLASAAFGVTPAMISPPPQGISAVNVQPLGGAAAPGLLPEVVAPLPQGFFPDTTSQSPTTAPFAPTTSAQSPASPPTPTEAPAPSAQADQSRPEAIMPIPLSPPQPGSHPPAPPPPDFTLSDGTAVVAQVSAFGGAGPNDVQVQVITTIVQDGVSTDISNNLSIVDGQIAVQDSPQARVPIAPGQIPETVIHTVTISDPAAPPPGPAGLPNVGPGGNPYEVRVPGHHPGVVITPPLIELQWVWRSGNMYLQHLVNGDVVREDVLIENSAPPGEPFPHLLRFRPGEDVMYAYLPAGEVLLALRHDNGNITVHVVGPVDSLPDDIEFEEWTAQRPDNVGPPLYSYRLPNRRRTGTSDPRVTATVVAGTWVAGQLRTDPDPQQVLASVRRRLDEYLASDVADPVVADIELLAAGEGQVRIRVQFQRGGDAVEVAVMAGPLPGLRAQTQIIDAQGRRIQVMLSDRHPDSPDLIGTLLHELWEVDRLGQHRPWRAAPPPDVLTTSDTAPAADAPLSGHDTGGLGDVFYLVNQLASTVDAAIADRLIADLEAHLAHLGLAQPGHEIRWQITDAAQINLDLISPAARQLYLSLRSPGWQAATRGEIGRQHTAEPTLATGTAEEELRNALARLAEVRVRIGEYRDAHPKVGGVSRWLRELEAMEGALSAAQQAPTDTSLAAASRHAAELGRLVAAVEVAQHLDGVVEVAAQVRGSVRGMSVLVGVDVVAERGRGWVSTFVDGAASPGSPAGDRVLRTARAQVQVAASTRRYDVSRRPPRVVLHFPNGVDWALAKRLYAMRAFDPWTGQRLPLARQPEVVIVGEVRSAAAGSAAATSPETAEASGLASENARGRDSSRSPLVMTAAVLRTEVAKAAGTAVPARAELAQALAAQAGAQQQVDARVMWVKWLAARLTVLDGLAAPDDRVVRAVADALDLPESLVRSLALDPDALPDPPPRLAPAVLELSRVETLRMVADHYRGLRERLEAATTALEQAEAALERAQRDAMAAIDQARDRAVANGWLSDRAARRITSGPRAELLSVVVRPVYDSRLAPVTVPERLPGLSWPGLRDWVGVRRALVDVVRRSEPARRAAEETYLRAVGELTQARYSLAGELGLGVSSGGGIGQALRARRLGAAHVSLPVTELPVTEGSIQHQATVGAVQDGLDTAVEALLTAQHAREQAHREYVDAVRDAVMAASARGLSNRQIGQLTRLSFDAVTAITRRPEQLPRQTLPVVDRVVGSTEALSRLTRRERRATAARRRFEALDASSPGFNADLDAMGVSPRVAARIGQPRRGDYFHDIHMHPEGYDAGRYVRYRDPHRYFTTQAASGLMVEWLRKEGRDTVVIGSPIPQRGMGLAAAGGAYYYALINSLRMGLLFGRQMLEMHGKFSDVRFFDFWEGLLAEELRWRWNPGISGLRVDVPGVGGYVTGMAVMHPEIAAFLAETTFAKEAVQPLLGRQSGEVLNPGWVDHVGQLLAAAALVRQDLASGRLAREALPASLVALFPQDGSPSGLAELDFYDALMASSDQLRAALRTAGRTDQAAALPTAVAEMYNPNLVELLTTITRTGQVLLVHHDAGLARLQPNGLYRAGPPDERNLMPMAALLRQQRFRDANVVWAHLGTGSWTTLTVEHVQWLRYLLDTTAVDLDISWNVVEQHIRSDPAVRDAVKQLILDYPDRIIFGTDALKPEPGGHYLRHFTDMSPLLAEIEAMPGGREAVARLLRRNFVDLHADAQQRVSRFIFNEVSSGAWDEFIRQFDPRRQHIVRDWMSRMHAEGWTPDPGYQPQGPGNWRDNPQMRSMIEWHAASNLATAAGYRSPRMLRYGFFVGLRDLGRDVGQVLAEFRQRRPRRGLPPLTDADAVLATPVTRDALIAAAAAREFTADLSDDVRGDRVASVLAAVEQTERDQREARAEIARLRRTLRKRVMIGAATVAAGTGALVAGLALAPVAAVPLGAVIALNGAAFVGRGMLNNARIAHTQQIRVMAEALVERGRLSPEAARWFADLIRDNIRHDVNIAGKFSTALADTESAVHALTEQFLTDFDAITRAPLGPDETADDRTQLAMAEFSSWRDMVNREVGGTVDSMNRLNPHAGLLGRVFNTALAGTWLANLAGHVFLAATTGGLSAVVAASYALVDTIFLSGTLANAVAGWAGYDSSLRPLHRFMQNALGFPALTVANALLTAHSIGDGHWLMAVSAATLTYATYYISRMGIAIEMKLGRPGLRYGPAASYIASSSLAGLGMMALSPDPVTATAATALSLSGPVIYLAKGAWDRWHKKKRRPVEYAGSERRQLRPIGPVSDSNP